MDDALALGCDLAHPLGVLTRSLLKDLLLLTDALALRLPVPLISDDVLQVLIHVDVVRADLLTYLLDHLFGQTDLTGDLDGKGAPRATY